MLAVAATLHAGQGRATGDGRDRTVCGQRQGSGPRARCEDREDRCAMAGATLPPNPTMSRAMRAPNAPIRARPGTIMPRVFIVVSAAIPHSTTPKPNSNPTPVGRVSGNRSPGKNVTEITDTSFFMQRTRHCLQTLRRPSRTCVRRRTEADGPALLHEFRRDALCRARGFHLRGPI